METKLETKVSYRETWVDEERKKELEEEQIEAMKIEKIMNRIKLIKSEMKCKTDKADVKNVRTTEAKRVMGSKRPIIEEKLNENSKRMKFESVPTGAYFDLSRTCSKDINEKVIASESAARVHTKCEDMKINCVSSTVDRFDTSSTCFGCSEIDTKCMNGDTMNIQSFVDD